MLKHLVQTLPQSTKLRLLSRWKRLKGHSAVVRHWVRNGHFVRALKVRQWSQQDRGFNLQIGGGRHSIAGWLNGDIIDGDIYLDATRKLPFRDGIVRAVFTEQFIEHITKRQAEFFLREAYRVLRPGGSIRIGTPDLERVFLTYLGENPLTDREEAITRLKSKHDRSIETPADFVNGVFRLWDHRYIYDETTLRLVLERSGFVGVVRRCFGESRFAELRNRERHADAEWMKDGYQLFMEARKQD